MTPSQDVRKLIERLRQGARAMERAVGLGNVLIQPSVDDSREAADLLDRLTSPEADAPVAWRWRWTYEKREPFIWRHVSDREHLPAASEQLVVEPLFASPPTRAAIRREAPDGWKLVPVKDTEEMWAGLARQIVMWRDMQDHSGRALYQHLRRSGYPAPEWLREMIPDTIHAPAKGDVAGAIYRAMIEAAPESALAEKDDT